MQKLSTVASFFDWRVFCAPLLRTDSEAAARCPEGTVTGDGGAYALSPLSRDSSEDSPGRNGVEASAARREFRFIIADIGQQQRVLHRHATGHFDELDKLLDTQRFLISRARAASRRETIRRGLGLNRLQRPGAGGRR